MRVKSGAEFSICGCLILAAAIMAFCLAVFLPDGKSFADQGFIWYVHPGERILFAERVAYATFCFMICLLSLLLYARRQQLIAIAQSGSMLLNLVLSLIVGLFGLLSIIYYSRDLSVAIATALTCVVSVFIARRVPSRIIGCASIILAVTVFFIAAAPGLMSPPDFSTRYVEAIADIETQQSRTTAAALQLAEGSKLFEAVGARYGVLWQSLLGAWTKLIHPLSIGDTVMFTRIMQTLFFAFAAVAYFIFSRRAFVAAALAVVFIAPWMELRQELFAFPHVTAWRYMSFSVAPLLVLLSARSSWPQRCILLGAVAGFGLLSDFSSGASVSAGLLVYLIFCKQSSPQKRTIFLYFSGLFAALAIFVAWFACVFGYVPSLSGFLSQLKNTAWEAAGGTAPVPVYAFDPLAIVILFHTSFVGLKLASRGPGALCSSDALRLFLCTASLLWLVHYVNEPNTLALRASRVLYGFFIVDLCRTLIVCKKYRRELGEPLWMLTLMLAAVIIPATILSYQPALSVAVSSLSNHEPRQVRKMLLSGVYLSQELGNALKQKAQFISETAGEAPIYYITADSSFVPSLSGKISAAPLADPFGQLVFPRQIEKYIERIVASGARTVYVDDPDFITAKGVCRRAFFDYLRVLLARNYRLSGSQQGWQIWVLKDSVSGAASTSNSSTNSGSNSLSTSPARE